MMRSAMLEVLREDYVRTARAKGLWPRLVLWRHAVRNAMLPVFTVIVLEFAFLIGGLVVTEQVFNLNGLGLLFVESIAHRDYTLTQALVLLVAVITVLANFVADLVGATLGAIVGVAGAYFGGLVDLLVERVVDILLSFPLIILALAVVASLGNGVGTVILAITVPMVPRCARVIRSSALAIRRAPYVDAARAAGYGHARIILRHMLPNVMAPYLIMVTAFMGQAILLEASLSFLGLGVAEPTPAWGLMLKGAAVDFAETAPWLALFPGLAISLAVLAFNLFGDSLRDALDPKLRTP